jgi:hypothetical protein
MRTRALVAALLAATLAAGCASITQRTLLREVVEESRGSTSTLGRVAVVAIDRDAASRSAWEEAFASRLGARGVAAAAGEGLRTGAKFDADAIIVDGAPVIEAARKSGADAILFVTPPNAVPVQAGRSAYRWFGAQSAPDPRTDLDTTPTSVTEVRLVNLKTNTGVWRAMVMQYYPKPGSADAPQIADAVMAGLAKRGYVR